MAGILITGGSGFFGKNFVKYLLSRSEYQRIAVFSRSEHIQADMAEELNHDPKLRWFIGDVRDRARLKRAMDGVDVVVHAAALKRIETGARNPIEMVRTNVDGAINVIEASQDAGVKKVVALSSDKACEPISPYGISKAMAETLFIEANNTVRGEPKYSCVRYGNVWASAGSVVPTWRKMIAAGKKTVPVSDPECTRFFMRIEEAVDLVNKTIETMKGGEIAIPDLPAYRLGDLAEAMGVGMDIRGLPAWEKRHEKMSWNKCSKDARRMNVEELRRELENVQPI